MTTGRTTAKSSTSTEKRAALACFAALCALAACAPAAPTPSPPQAPPAREVTTAPAACPEGAPELAEDGVEVEGKPMGLRIERICMYGLGAEAKAAVDSALTLQVGRALSQEDVRASLEQLTKTDLFEDVRLGAEARGDATTVYVVLRERPRIEEVVYEPATAKQPAGPADLGGRADPYVLREMTERMEDDIREKGHGGAKVEMTIEPTQAGRARVRVKIDLGPAWTIAKTSFLGASRVPEADLRAASAVAIGSAWNPGAIRGAALRVTSLYYDRGFVLVKVDEPEQSVDASGGVSLAWKIDEGAAYTLGKITFRGKLVDKKTQGELSALMKSRPKAIFNRSQVAADIERIRDFFAKRGAKVEVTPGTQFDKKQKAISLDLEVSEQQAGN